MYEKNVLRLCVDVSMTLVYAALMTVSGTGLLFHELAGLGVALLFALHFGLNLRMLQRLKKNKAALHKSALFISDLALPAGLITTVGTGALISRAVFDSSLSNSLLLFQIHKVSAWICCGILAFHLVLHLRFVVGIAKNILKRLQDKGVTHTLASCAAGLLVIAVLFARVYTVIGQNSDAAQEALAGLTASTVTTDDSVASEDSAAESSSGTTTKKDDEQSQTQSGSDAAEEPSLNEYLGKLFCTGCHRHCCLLTPACGRGQQKAEQAQVEYAEEYSNGV
jgi:hypothetical protein